MDTKHVLSEARFSPEKMQKVALYGSPHYFCDLYCLEPGQEQRVHSHPGSDKIYYVIEGQGVFHIAGDEKSLGPGQIVIARPGEDHGVANRTPSNLVLLVFMTPRP